MKLEERYRKCCGKFYPKNTYQLKPTGYSEGIMEIGFCPVCGVLVVEVGKRDYNGEWTYINAKRKKAQRLYDDMQTSITDELVAGKIKHGTKSNMGFRYGVNEVAKNNKGEIIGIRRKSVDFNETVRTKELI